MLKRLLLSKTDSSSIQLFRYTAVGGLAFVVDFGFLFLFTDLLKFQYLISGAIAFLMGLFVNYFLSIKWIFQKRTKKKFVEFLLFSAIGVIGLGINEVFLWLLTDGAHLYYLFSKIIATFFVYFWNFFARKLTLFS